MNTQSTLTESRSQNQDYQELVTCVLGDVEFGLDINSVQEIVRMPKITPVPRAPSYVEGVANLRGNVLPIINSRVRFGMPAAANCDNHRVVVVEQNGVPTGLIVDAVREVMHVCRKDVEDAPLAVQDANNRFIKGVLKLDGGKRLVMLLDKDAVMERPVDTATQSTANQGDGHASAQNSEINSESEYEQLISFRIGDEEYGVPITDVQEIIRVPHISVVPNAPLGVVGIASLRNRILPVMDLRTKFGFRSLKEEAKAFCTTTLGFETQIRELHSGLAAAVTSGQLIEAARLRPLRDVGRWLDSFSTSDKLVGSLLQPLQEAQRELLTAAIRLVHRSEARDQDGVRREFANAVRPAHATLTGLFEKLSSGLARRDDERCLVVNVASRSLALRVDAVNQVLQAPKSCVEATPTLVAGKRAEQTQIRGIAKLENGKRLIMLLSTEKLASPDELDNLTSTQEDSQEVASDNGRINEDDRQFVSFKVADEEFAIDIMQVQEIIRLERVTKVPQAPEFVEGVVNLRGNVLPVIDLRKRVHLPPRTHNDSTRVVVVDLGGRKTGIIVDSVSEVMRVNRRDIEPAPEIIMSTYGDQFIEGVGKRVSTSGTKGGRMFLLLRADELLGQEDRQSVAQAM